MTSIASDVGEPRLRWVAALYQAFEAMMEARLEDAERLSEMTLAIGTEIGEPDAFSFYAGQLFANRSFAGRYDELLPLVQGRHGSQPRPARVPAGLCDHLPGGRSRGRSPGDPAHRPRTSASRRFPPTTRG